MSINILPAIGNCSTSEHFVTHDTYSGALTWNVEMDADNHGKAGAGMLHVSCVLDAMDASQCVMLMAKMGSVALLCSVTPTA